MMRTLFSMTLSLVCLSAYATTHQPNIIVILADDMGYSDIGCYGGEIETPYLDSMADSGLRFRNFYNTSRCCPSRAVLLTGRYQHQVGVGEMDSNLGAPGYLGYINRESVTIAEVLKNHGYYTAMSGKWHLGSSRPNWPIDRGFERMFSSPNGGGYYFVPFETANRPVYLNETQITPAADFYSTDDFTDYGLQFIDEALSADKPFFLYLAYIAPHFPLEAYQEDVNKYLTNGVYSNGWDPVRANRLAKQKASGGIAESLNGTAGEWALSPGGGSSWSALSTSDKARIEEYMALYAAVIDRMDWNIGRLLDKLDNPDGDTNTVDSIANNTIVVFVSDNGAAESGGNTGSGTTGSPIFGNTSDSVKYGRSWGNACNTPFRRYKADTQEGGILTPCVVRWPDGITLPGGTIVTNRAHFIDIAATCIDVAGVAYPSNYNGNVIQPIEGISLTPLFSPTGTIDRTSPLFFEHLGERAVIDGDWKLMSRNNTAWELYNLAVDPQELNNLASGDPTRVAELSEIWFEWAHDANVKDYRVTNLQRISLVPAEDQASVSGPVEGSISLLRSTSSGAVDVYMDIGGTAVAGIDYTTLPEVVGFTSGNTTAQLVVTPLPGGVTRETKSVEVTVKPRYWYVEPSAASTIWISPDNYDSWALTHLPATAYSDADRLPFADPDGDGVPNYQERGRGTDPAVNDGTGSEVLSPMITGMDPGYFTFRFLEDPGTPEVDWKVWLSDDLATWRDGTDEMVMSTMPTGSQDLVSMVWTQSVSAADKQFARLQWVWEGGLIMPTDPLALYTFDGGSRASSDTNAVVSGDYAGGTVGIMPNETRSPSAGIVAYSLGAETVPTASHSFSVDFNGGTYNLSMLSYNYHATNIDFTKDSSNSSFSYELTSDVTGGTVLASETFTSSSGGIADFTANETVDLSSIPVFQGITGTVTFTFTFTDNSTGTGRSHGIDNLVLSGQITAP